jgi:hypothetical protein
MRPTFHWLTPSHHATASTPRRRPAHHFSHLVESAGNVKSLLKFIARPQLPGLHHCGANRLCHSLVRPPRIGHGQCGRLRWPWRKCVHINVVVKLDCLPFSAAKDTLHGRRKVLGVLGWILKLRPTLTKQSGQSPGCTQTTLEQSSRWRGVSRRSDICRDSVVFQGRWGSPCLLDKVLADGVPSINITA